MSSLAEVKSLIGDDFSFERIVITSMNMKMLPFQISADPLCNSSS